MTLVLVNKSQTSSLEEAVDQRDHKKSTGG
jgi:hypothetical protein